MKTLKISELPKAELTSDNVDNCFYVEDMNKPSMKAVPMDKVFDWIRERAKEEGLTVELRGERIIFIKG